MAKRQEIGLLQGSYTCGNVHFQFSGPLRPFNACPYTRYRKRSGRLAATTSTPCETVTVHGEIPRCRSARLAQRGYCANYRSGLTWDPRGEGLRIRATIPDGETSQSSAECVRYELDDGLPAVAAGDPQQSVDA